TWFFQGIEEFAFIVTRNVLVKIVGIVCVFAFVKVKEDVVIYAVIMQGTAFIGNLIVIPYLRKFVSLIPITQIHILPHIKGSMIYFIPTIATSVYTMLDKAMIGWVTKSSYENGYYEQAYKIVQIVLVVVTSLRTVTLPRVVHLYSEKNYKQVMEMVDGTIRFILLLSMPMSAGLIMVAPQLVPIFLGEGYEKCIIIVRILAVLIVVLGLSTLISGQCLTAMGKQKQANSCVIVGAAINFTMNLVLIPKCGALGAAIATVTAETIILAMFIVFGAEYIRLKEASKYFLEYLLCSLVMAVCIYGLRYTGLQNMGLFISQIAVGIVVYFAILLLIKDDMIMNFIHNIKHKKRLD
ncbi:MAG: polysaccharide biosynthesis C-terminal domain-containing protein, partial [Clostridia bacterium]|nr:polysaccharide biosynthesis C-terminal domain-containing protein [Clostridia bacterium]